MREYIYIWNDPENNFLVASGIEFKDFKNTIDSSSRLLFLDHLSEHLQFDQNTGFDFTDATPSNPIWIEDVYRWGNCVWVDFIGDVLPNLSDSEISELLFFKHKTRPLSNITLEKLQNKFLAFSHDDGFFLKLYYSSWNNVAGLITFIQKKFEVDLDVSELRNGDVAFWMERSKIEKLEKTLNIDSILNRKINSKNNIESKKSVFSGIFRKNKIV